jgi:hemoglobin
MNTAGPSPQASLYQRIGGYDVLAAVVDDLFALMRADSRFARFGAGRSIDSRHRAQQLTVDFLCSLSGGPCYYTGRDMRTSHAGLQIVESEWDATIQMTKKALQNHSVGPQEQSDFIALFEQFRNDIIETA